MKGFTFRTLELSAMKIRGNSYLIFRIKTICKKKYINTINKILI